MFNSRGLLSFFIALFFYLGLISASPVPPKGHAPVPSKGHAPLPPKGHAPAPANGHAAQCPANLQPRSNNKVFLGYNGFNGTPRNPQASAGGQLGAVFYIADAVDLAKAFAHGADPSRDYVCLVFGEADKWIHLPKVWVPAATPRGNAMNAEYPGSILFDHHTNAGLPAGSPAAVHQMGIRQAQIERLGVTVECYHKSCFANDHHMLNYESMKAHWNIHTP